MPTDSAKRTGSNSDRMIRILLIEDHVVLREGLRSLLEMEADLSIIGEAGSGEEGLQIAADKKPDLIITDIGLPGRSGLSIIPDLRLLDPTAHILVLTAHCTDEYVRAALDAGADGYILKDAERSDLIHGIHTVVEGQKYFSQAVAERVVSGFLGTPAANDELTHGNITNRERQVLMLIASANSNKRIAAQLELSIKTVEKHRSNLMRKLNLRSAAAVTLYAVRHHLITADGEPCQAGFDI
jgi:DNA-binding NarL/FixJ family response regulator